MTDLDFDELDKTINELYESLDEVLDDSAATTTTTTVTTVVTKKPAVAPATDEVADEASAKGRFMDMVNASGDVQLRHKPNYAAERQAELDTTDDADKKVADDEPTAPTKIAVEIAGEGDSTDNTDIASAKSESARVAIAENDDEVVEIAKSPKVPRPAKTNLPITDLTPITDDVVAEARESHELPFLPDAKVEKRPLGQPATTKQSLLNQQNAADQPEPDYISDRHAKRQAKKSAPNKRRAWLSVLKWLILFILVIAAGALTGLALYYFTGM